jgi:Leucine-rich repeat (LRR) protein
MFQFFIPSRWPNAKVVSLRGNGLTSLKTVLKGLVVLEKLSVSDNELSDISFVQSFPSLISLDVSKNKISFISTHEQNENLKVFNISMNQLKECGWVLNYPSLKELCKSTRVK